MYSTAMQHPYYCVGAPMNVFMLIHDSPRHWLVCRKINKFNHHLFDLRIYTYHQNSQTSKHRCGARCIVQLFTTLISVPLNPWMYLCRFMIHRDIDWCTAKSTNSTITYLISESTRIIRILKQANIAADSDEQHNHSTPKLLLGGSMNVFMTIHDPSSNWLVCRKNHKFNRQLFDLRIYSYHQNSQTSNIVMLNLDKC